LLEYLKREHPELGTDIVQTGDLSAETEAGLRQALDDFKRTWSAEAAEA